MKGALYRQQPESRWPMPSSLRPDTMRSLEPPCFKEITQPVLNGYEMGTPSYLVFLE